MMQQKHLAGYIYHMTHLANLRSIFQHGALFSKELLVQERYRYHSIANEEVQGLRDRIFVHDIVKSRYRNLHSYVPFYFAEFPPMIWEEGVKKVKEDLVVFYVKRYIISESGVLFTDGNASNQQLSKKSEIVHIIPKNASSESCEREYLPSGPNGHNSSCSDFYAGVFFLDYVNWSVINGTDHVDNKNEYVRAKSAEVLVPDKLLLDKVQKIGVRTDMKMREVNNLIDEFGLKGRITSVMVNNEHNFRKSNYSYY